MAGIPASGGWKSDDWRRWFDGLIEGAASTLEDLGEGRGDPPRNVHETRKILKRLRTGTRLLHGFADKATLKSHRLLFRDAARLLAGSRDGTVRLRTFNSLVGDNDKNTKGALATVRLQLAQEAAEGEERASEGAEEALRLLKQAGIPKRFWNECGKNDVKRSLRRLLKRARGDYHDVRDGVSHEFHELRKRVKDLYYALEALPGEPRGARRRVLASLNVLEESLGLQNDVFVLEEWFNRNGCGLKECPQFWEAAARREKKLRKTILREAAVLDELVSVERSGKVFTPAN